MIDLTQAQAELRAAGLNGWLLYDFKGLNPLALDAAGLGGKFLTRRWFCLIPAAGEPRWVVHSIERAQFEGVRGERLIYARRTELVERLKELVAGAGGPRLAMEYSPSANVPAISRVDAGTIELVRAAGAEVVSSGDLVQALLARWPARGRALHDAAWRTLERAVKKAWASIGSDLRAGRTPTEVAVQRLVMGELEADGLISNAPPIVAAGAHAADPHYETGGGPGHDAPIGPGSVVMLDVWAKKGGDPDAIYADVTFMAYVGARPSARAQQVWQAVAGARDAGLARAQELWRAGGARAFEVDRAARAVVEAAGFGPYFTHRTGHSLGQEDHWIGAHMDDFETHDDRRIVAGTGFTIEPGVYIPGELGMRSEIDVFVEPGGPVATTEIQRDLVCIPTP